MKYNSLKYLSLIFSLFLITSIVDARDRDAFRVGGDIVIQENETVNSAVAIGGDVTVYGNVEEEAVAIGGSVYLKDGSYVEGDAVSIGGKVYIENNAEFKGDIVDVGNLISLFSGKSEHHFPGEHHHHEIPAFLKILPFLAFLIIGLLITTFIPNSIRSTMNLLDQRALGAFGIGVLGFIAFFPMILTLIISLLGIPLIPLFVTTYILTVVFGYLGASAWLGDKVLAALKYPGKHILLVLVTGLIIIKIVGYIPGLGGLFKAVVVTLGLGAVLINLKGRFSKKTTPKELVEPAAE